MTLFNWARPRDLAHLETFTHFHETFYARVEPLSVTPFADRALDRGLAAVLVAALRHARSDWESEPGAQSVPVPMPMSTPPSSGSPNAPAMCSATLAGWLKSRPHAAPCSTTGTDDARASRSADCPTRVTETASTHSWTPGAGRWGTWSAGWSLREVEPETNLLITLAAPEVADRPGWAFGLGPGPAVDEEDEDDTEPADEAGLLTAQPVFAAEGEPNR